MHRKVDFFICGMQKSGTTALDAYLRTNGSLQMATTKEVHHFDDEGLDWTAPDHRRLHDFFDWSKTDVLRGEATPIYTYWPNALDRLKAYNPSARLIVGLRHPTFRAYSHWRMESTRGLEQMPFALAIRNVGRKRVLESPGQVHRVYSYVERGHYAAQIQKLLDLFPRNQLFFFRTDTLWTKPQSVIKVLEGFLGVRLLPMQSGHYVSPLNSGNFGDLEKNDREFLDDVFKEDIETSAKISGLDLSDWLSPRYRDPMAP